MLIADTDVLIDFLRGRGAMNERVATSLREKRLATTAVSVFELRAGAHSTRQRERLAMILDVVEVLPVDEDAAIRAGELSRGLRESGLALPAPDCLIAGVCQSKDAVLITRNRNASSVSTGSASLPSRRRGRQPPVASPRPRTENS